jgi:hypothetical protein
LVIDASFVPKVGKDLGLDRFWNGSQRRRKKLEISALAWLDIPTTALTASVLNRPPNQTTDSEAHALMSIWINWPVVSASSDHLATSAPMAITANQIHGGVRAGAEQIGNCASTQSPLSLPGPQRQVGRQNL